jgi:CheY-like chemotaxis protein
MRILFADDEASLQELMRIELPRLGHEATVCPDGRTALAALDRTAFDCVIVDLDMPGLGGLDVIARVRETSPDTEAVIITGKSTISPSRASSPTSRPFSSGCGRSGSSRPGSRRSRAACAVPREPRISSVHQPGSPR